MMYLKTLAFLGVSMLSIVQGQQNHPFGKTLHRALDGYNAPPSCCKLECPELPPPPPPGYPYPPPQGYGKGMGGGHSKDKSKDKSKEKKGKHSDKGYYRGLRAQSDPRRLQFYPQPYAYPPPPPYGYYPYGGCFYDCSSCEPGT